MLYNFRLEIMLYNTSQQKIQVLIRDLSSFFSFSNVNFIKNYAL